MKFHFGQTVRTKCGIGLITDCHEGNGNPPMYFIGGMWHCEHEVFEIQKTNADVLLERLKADPLLLAGTWVIRDSVTGKWIARTLEVSDDWIGSYSSFHKARKAQLEYFEKFATNKETIKE